MEVFVDSYPKQRLSAGRTANWNLLVSSAGAKYGFAEVTSKLPLQSNHHWFSRQLIIPDVGIRNKLSLAFSCVFHNFNSIQNIACCAIDFNRPRHVYFGHFLSEAVKFNGNHSANRTTTRSDLCRSQQRSHLFSAQVSCSWYHPWLCCLDCPSQQLRIHCIISGRIMATRVSLPCSSFVIPDSQKSWVKLLTS